MCTSVVLNTLGNKWFFGRNMDLSYDFNEAIYQTPKDFSYTNIITKEKKTAKYSVLGMGTKINGHLLFADGMNSQGLCVAGLNFEGFASFEKEEKKDKINISASDFIAYTLYNYKTVDEFLEDAFKFNLMDAQINEKTEVAKLHWMIADKSGNVIVAEKTKAGFKTYKNTVYTMTNNPTFDWHLTNLREYLFVNQTPHKTKKWCAQELSPLGVGSGSLGLPGDFSSVSRFVRMAYLRNNLPPLNTADAAVMQCFNMLFNVAMVKGSVFTENKKDEFTVYSACMDLENKIYYYKTYNGSEIRGIRMNSNGETQVEIPVVKVPSFSYEG